MLRACLPIVAVFVVSVSWSAGVGRWEYYTGKGYTVCDALYKRLNRYRYPDPDNANNCAWQVALSYPGFTEPPWEELGTTGHEELIYRLLKYADGTGTKRPERVYQEAARRFIEEGGRVQLWRTRLISNFGSKEHPEVWAPPGLQNVIQLRYPKLSAEQAGTVLCPTAPQADWQGGQVFIANDDLTDVHPDIGYVGVILANMTLVLYSERPYFLSGLATSSITLGRNESTGLTDFCDIRYNRKARGN